MKLIALPLALAAILAACGSEAASPTPTTPNPAGTMAADAANKVLEQVKTSLTNITNVEQARAALPSLEALVPKVSEALKTVTGTWPASLTATADAIREQITRLSSMAEVKDVLGAVLEKIKGLLPPK